MTDRIHFSKTDIGGEILPILTLGLYRDTLDALREYIQNSIDASATEIELIIDPDTVAVVDNGEGMNGTAARQALRLGISEKNPTENIGFRGIGIYSAFNLCDLLEIFTKANDSKEGYYLRFDFRTVRTQLLAEQERRKKGVSSKLYLEKLLEDSVYVQPDSNRVVEDHGTKVVMSGILSDAYSRLLDWEEVESYLRDVVPLPFNPDFRFAKQIERKFKEEDYRVVPLTLQINNRCESLYRPYTNEMFAQGGKYPPKVFPLKAGQKRFGFAWVCINDERRVLKDTSLRGLLIKKFGFSIATRSYLEPFFTRTVFNRRVTGEIIIQHPDLLPNAARSDFENNSARQKFLELLPEFIQELSDWANNIQEEEKAREVLNNAGDVLAKISTELTSHRRDKDKMLEYNVKLADQEHKLKTHKKTLEANTELKEDYLKVQQVLKDNKAFVKNALSQSVAASKRLENDVIKTIQSEVNQISASPSPAEIEGLTDLVSVLEGAGFQVSADLKSALKLFESECLLTHLDKALYTLVLTEFKDILEERF